MTAYAGPTTTLLPDKDVIHSFVEWWFRYCRRGRLEIGWTDCSTGLLNKYERFELGEAVELASRACAVNMVPGQSVYIRAATISTPDGETTKDEYFCQAPGPWGDLDSAEDVARAKSVQTMVRPNAIVRTGTLPHERYQSWFQCSEPIPSPDMIRSLNKRILALFSGDSLVINPTRYMRLPGTIAWPLKEGRSVPELTWFFLSSDRPPYPISTLAAQLPKDEESSKRGGAPPSAIGGLNKVSDLIREIQSGHEWHNNTLRLTAHWIGRGWSNTEILAASEALTLPGYTVTQTRADVLKMLDGGRKRWGIEDSDPTLAADPATPFRGGIADPWDTLVPPAFPIHALPSILRDFVEVRARVMGADPCALAWACLSACSAAIPGSVRLQVKRHEHWSVPPSLWVALIGTSSAKKSPIISAAWRPLEMVQSSDLRDYMTALKRWEAIPKKERGGEPEPLHPRRLVTHDATMESIQDLLSRQNRGIADLRDELSGFIAGMDKYTNGKGGSERAFFLQCYNGGPYVADRIGRGTTAIENLLVTVCGGIQPDRLSKFADLADDGLWQRFVPIIVTKTGVMDTDEAAGDESDAYGRLIHRLLQVPPETRAAFSEPAHAVREHLARELFEFEQREPMNGHFTSFVGKLLGMWARLSLVLSQVEPHALAPHVVGERAAESARILIQRCVIPHAAQVYLTMGEGAGTHETTKSIAGFILAKKLTRLLSSDLSRRVRACRGATVPAIQQMVSPLIAAGWLAPEREDKGNHGWIVNVKVHDKFADRAGREAKRRAEVQQLITGEEEFDD